LLAVLSQKTPVAFNGLIRSLFGRKEKAPYFQRHFRDKASKDLFMYIRLRRLHSILRTIVIRVIVFWHRY